MGITVIMASYLGEYPGSRSNPVQKFIRAVKSFQEQTLKEKQLIIVSDGCGLTNATYEDLFKSDPQITLIRFEKQEGWPGPLREAARSIAKYEWIMYLDSDDFFLNDYLEKSYNQIMNNNDNLVFVIKGFFIPIENGIYDENITKLYLFKREDIEKHLLNSSFLTEPYIGRKYKILGLKLKDFYVTWQIIHNNKVNARWNKKIDIKGGEDKEFIQSVLQSEKYLELNTYGYVQCHQQDRNNFNPNSKDPVELGGTNYIDF